jgi:hypothetical protein
MIYLRVLNIGGRRVISPVDGVKPGEDKGGVWEMKEPGK